MLHISGGKKVSLATCIFSGGGATIEKAAKSAGTTSRVPFHAGAHGCIA